MMQRVIRLVLPRYPNIPASGILAKHMWRMSLSWKTYLALAGILLPVFALSLFIQSKLSQPLLEEEVRQIGVSVSKSLATDIIAFKLLSEPAQLEARLIEATWLQPSIVRLDVIVPSKGGHKLLASNVDEAGPLDPAMIPSGDLPRTELKQDGNRRYWDIYYPIKSPRRVRGFIHAEVSLQLVDQVVSTFVKTDLAGDLVAMVLLILLLSYYLRRVIRSEQRLRKAETKNLELSDQLFMNEKLAIMGQLTASFAHEVGTPLNSMSGHLQLLRGELNEPATQNRVDIITSQLSRIEDIVKNFLASTHTPPQQLQLVDVAELVERIIKLVGPRLHALNVEVVTTFEPQLEKLRLVPTDLEQVLLNLTNNAMDAMERVTDSRQLRFQARSVKENGKKFLELCVVDTGEGIAKEAIKQVLKPFYTTKAPGQGTGLGLTISQRLVKKYSGRLSVTSELGKGTQVKVNIPYDAS